MGVVATHRNQLVELVLANGAAAPPNRFPLAPLPTGDLCPDCTGML